MKYLERIYNILFRIRRKCWRNKRIKLYNCLIWLPQKMSFFIRFMEVYNVQRRHPHSCSVSSGQTVPEHTLGRTYTKVRVAIQSYTTGAPTWPSLYQAMSLPQRTESPSPCSQTFHFYPSHCTQYP